MLMGDCFYVDGLPLDNKDSFYRIAYRQNVKLTSKIDLQRLYCRLFSLLRIRDPVIFWPLDPDPGYLLRIRDPVIFWPLDPDPG